MGRSHQDFRIVKLPPCVGTQPSGISIANLAILKRNNLAVPGIESIPNNLKIWPSIFVVGGE
jgi:hypothetical protein